MDAKAGQESVAVFLWMQQAAAASEPEAQEWDPEKETLLASRAPAFALVRALRGQGNSVHEPEEDEQTWCFSVGVGGDMVDVVVLWTAIDYPPHNYIAAQWRLRRPLLPRLLHVPLSADAVARCHAALDLALRSIPEVADLRWMSDEEFGRSYGGGFPLSAPT